MCMHLDGSNSPIDTGLGIHSAVSDIHRASHWRQPWVLDDRTALGTKWRWLGGMVWSDLPTNCHSTIKISFPSLLPIWNIWNFYCTYLWSLTGKSTPRNLSFLMEILMLSKKKKKKGILEVKNSEPFIIAEMEILREIKIERNRQEEDKYSLRIKIKWNKNHLSLSPDDVPHLRAISSMSATC